MSVSRHFLLQTRSPTLPEVEWEPCYNNKTIRVSLVAGCCTDAELVFNAVIALAMVQPFHTGETLISVLCEKLGGHPGDKQSSLRLRL